MDSAISFINIESTSTGFSPGSSSTNIIDHAHGRQARSTESTESLTQEVDDDPTPVEPVPVTEKLHGSRAILLAFQLTLMMFTNSFTTGVMTVGVVTMAKDLKLDSSLVFWPVLAYTLTSSPLMLPFGSVADVLGSKPLNLAGCFLCGIFVLACGFVQNGMQLIVFRAMQGVGAALVLPTAMGIVASSIQAGRMRNMTLAFLGMGQVVGYAAGLVLSGVFFSTIGWRFGFWLCGAIQLTLFGFGIWAIPKTEAKAPEGSSLFHQLRTKIDWFGAAICCASIAMISYVLAMIAETSAAIKQPVNIVLLSLSLILIPGFGAWMSYQERRDKPALIPNSLWKPTFVSLCVMVAFVNAEMQCMEFLSSLFFQNVQQLSILESSIRLLPGMVVGSILNVATGYMVHKVSVQYLITGVSIVAAASPLLMALINPTWPYWYDAFPAQVLYPMCVDVIFVVGALIVSEVFPERDQALAGAVFNTIANLGQAIGLAIIAVISNTVSQDQEDPDSPMGLLEGYRAGFFAAFAWMILTAIIGLFGLRKVGKVGVKRD